MIGIDVCGGFFDGFRTRIMVRDSDFALEFIELSSFSDGFGVICPIRSMSIAELRQFYLIHRAQSFCHTRDYPTVGSDLISSERLSGYRNALSHASRA
jgi:hypothetical protein